MKARIFRGLILSVILCANLTYSAEEYDYASAELNGTDASVVVTGQSNFADEMVTPLPPPPVSSRRPSRPRQRPVRPKPPPPPTQVVLGSGSVIRGIGAMQCAGIDRLTGRRFVEAVLGPGNDASGSSLCLSTCGGECVPNQNFGVAPRSLQPFGCQCKPNRCTSQGPVIDQLGNGRFQIVCVRDSRCTCDEMRVSISRYDGYLCNWMNINNRRPGGGFRPQIFVHPTFSPVRWCSCCPKTGILIASASDQFSSYDYPSGYYVT